MRRPLLLSVAATTVAGALLLLAPGRVWGSATVRAAVGARQHVTVTGHTVAPSLSALGLALLALAVALIAANGVLRRVAGLLVVVIGAAAIPVAVDGHSATGRKLADAAFGSAARSLAGPRPAWWLLAAGAGLLAVAAGATVAVRGGRWSGLGARYDAPGSVRRAAPDPERDVWEALDEGHDPTAAE